MFLPLVGIAQTSPQFDVASVKVDNAPLVPGVSGRFGGGPTTTNPGRFTATQVSLKRLIGFAYRLAPDQLRGPTAMDVLLTVAASVPPNTTEADFHLMLQNLLKERFHLVVHQQIQNQAGYELVVLPSGHKLREWHPDLKADVPEEFPQIASDRLGVSLSLSVGSTGMMRSTHHQSMADFVKVLGDWINVSAGLPGNEKTPRVADKTGLVGTFLFWLAYEGNIANRGMTAIVVESDRSLGIDTNALGDGPTLFEALEKQLGLKLIKAKNVAVPILVVDHADKVPSAN